MARRKLIIHIADGVSEQDAIERVLHVVKAGRISTERGIETFCFVTSWEGGARVSCRPRSATTDTMHVWKSKPAT